MDKIAQSLAGLVKTNGGFFKSEKQAKFLLSMLNHGDSHVSIGQVFNNSFMLDYYCDNAGVTKVVKRTNKKETVTWKRGDTTKETYESKKADLMKQYQEDIARIEKQIEECIQERDAIEKVIAELGSNSVIKDLLNNKIMEIEMLTERKDRVIKLIK